MEDPNSIFTEKDPNAPEEVIKRALQDDPIVMYLIVRESLGMGPGKIAAQCAHAAQMITLQYFREREEWERGFDPVYGPSKQDLDAIPKDDILRWNMFFAWLQDSFRKVVLRADDKEWEKLKAEIPISHRKIVIDAGLTEVVAGSETVIGLWPMKKSERPKLIKKLQVLK